MSTEDRVIRTLRNAGFTVLTRKQWGSKFLAGYQTRRVTRRFVGPADYAFAHISVTVAGNDPKAAARTIEQIGLERFGTGWSYNWGLHLPSKTILVGQPMDAAGAHTLNDKNVAGFPENLNYWGHAIAWIGNVGDQWTQWAENAAAAILAAERRHGAMKRPQQMFPHSKFAWKDCPTDPYRNAIPRIVEKSRSIHLGLTQDEQAQREQERAERRRERKRVRRQERREAELFRLRQAAKGGEGVTRVEEARADLELARRTAKRKDKVDLAQRIQRALDALKPSK